MKGLGLCQAARQDKHFLPGYYPPRLLAVTRSPPNSALPRAVEANGSIPGENLLTGETQPCDAGGSLKTVAFPLQSCACRCPISGVRRCARPPPPPTLYSHAKPDLAALQQRPSPREAGMDTYTQREAQGKSGPVCFLSFVFFPPITLKYRTLKRAFQSQERFRKSCLKYLLKT